MANKFLIGSTVVAVMMFAGCASKEVTTTEAPKVTPAPVVKEAVVPTTTDTAPVVAAGSALEIAQSKLQTVLFDYDKYNIRPDMQAIVDMNAKVSGGSEIAGAKVKLEGNADERGTDEYNYALALKRANAVKAGYEAKGIATANINTVSLGEGNPVCKESNEACWSKNRRVDTKLEK
jgi:peptidoglycan-associated lipoprotein